MAPFDDVLLTSVPEHDLDLVNERFPGARVETARLSPALAERHSDARVLAVMIHDPVTVEALSRFDALAGVITRSDGYDHLPAAWLVERGVPGLHLEGYATESVAQLTLAFIIALTRRLPEALATTLGERPRWERGALVGRRLDELSVGVVGVGRIGEAVVRALAPFGCTLVGHDIAPRRTLQKEVPGFAFVDALDDLLAASDVVSLHVPLTEATRGLLDAGALARMRAGACLVNTARGDVVDQRAVAAALRERRLGGYAADVLPGEPAPPELDAFQGLDNVLLTPHLGAHNGATVRARYEHTARAARALLGGDADGVAAYRVL